MPIDFLPIKSYTIQVSQSHEVLMVSYNLAQKQKVRLTIELEVFPDFDARQIDFEKLFGLEPSEKVSVYIEEFDRV